MTQLIIGLLAGLLLSAVALIWYGSRLLRSAARTSGNSTKVEMGETASAILNPGTSREQRIEKDNDWIH